MLYNPDLDGMEQIDQAIKTASTAGKHVLVQVGGNWCPWCIKQDGGIGATINGSSVDGPHQYQSGTWLH